MRLKFYLVTSTRNLPLDTGTGKILPVKFYGTLQVPGTQVDTVNAITIILNFINFTGVLVQLVSFSEYPRTLE
jgi:hypothetical protein